MASTSSFSSSSSYHSIVGDDDGLNSLGFASLRAAEPFLAYNPIDDSIRPRSGSGQGMAEEPKGADIGLQNDLDIMPAQEEMQALNWLGGAMDPHYEPDLSDDILVRS